MIAIWFAIILFFMIWGIRNYKTSFLTYAAVSILINAGMAIKYSPPSIGVSLVLNLYFVTLYFYKVKRKIHASAPLPLKKSFWWMSFSISIAAIITLANGSVSGITNAINTIFGIYLFIFVFWNVCNEKNDIKYFIKCLTIVFVICYIYGLFEYFTHSNPILDSIESVIPEEYSEGKLAMSDMENLRDGRARAQSLFGISILYGNNTLLFLFFILYANKYKQFLNMGALSKCMLIVFSLFACYTSNSKTPIVALPIFIIPYILKNRTVTLVFVAVSLVLITNLDYFFVLLNEVVNLQAFDVKNDDMSGGSNIYMRLMQLEASIEYWMKAPIFGNGLRSSAIFSDKDPRLLGCESVWFITMIEKGFLGLITYIVLIIDCFKASLRYDGKYYILMYSVAFFVICSITDTNYTMYFMCICIMMKLCIYNLNK